MPLVGVEAGKAVTIEAFDMSPELALRCRCLGLFAGEHIEVLRNRKPSPLIVAAAGARLMIGRELAGRLSVRLEAPEAAR